jgi:hypothetical protein
MIIGQTPVVPPGMRRIVQTTHRLKHAPRFSDCMSTSAGLNWRETGEMKSKGAMAFFLVTWNQRKDGEDVAGGRPDQASQIKPPAHR